MRNDSVWKLVWIPALALALAGAGGEQDRHGAAPPPVDGPAALSMLKTLQGIWEGDEGPSGRTVHLVYRVTARGNTVEETFRRGSKLEMLTVYYLDTNDDLRLTHFCAARNRPEMRLNKAISTPQKLVFEFAGGAVQPEVDIHMHNGSISLHSPVVIETDWSTWKGGVFFANNPVQFKRLPSRVRVTFGAGGG